MITRQRRFRPALFSINLPIKSALPDTIRINKSEPTQKEEMKPEIYKIQCHEQATTEVGKPKLSARHLNSNEEQNEGKPKTLTNYCIKHQKILIPAMPPENDRERKSQTTKSMTSANRKSQNKRQALYYICFHALISFSKEEG